MIPLQRQTDTRANNTASFPNNSSVIGNKLSHEIKRINQMINEIFSGTDLRDFTSSPEQLNRLGTSSCVDESSVFGREDDARKIKDMLVDTSSSSSVNLNPYKETPSIIPIVGFVGVGKTRLAQLVYNDERVIQHFQHRMWVCVLDEFDIFSILRKILESIAGNVCEQHKNLDAMVCKFHECMNGKKYLLVLDDVRRDDVQEWEKLKILLQIDEVHQQGSKILVTTPSDKVASMVGGSIPPYRLQRLSEEECWSIMKKIAFSSIRAMETPKNLQIGRDAARLCCGVPLIAIRLVDFLHSKKNETSWLALRPRDLASVYSRILPQMMFMYDDFPLHLKKFFSYFSIFPQDQIIQRDLLIRFWMAEGFIKLSDETNEMSMEDIGKQYFNNLLGSQIFEVADIEKDNFGSVKSIRLDELTHRLAREVAEDCPILQVSEMENITDQVRRLRLVCEQDVEPVSTLDNLRTLVGIQRLNSKQIANVFSNKHLRVLELRNCRIGMLPDLSKLIHLRYLDLSDCHYLLLGQSISSLWYLLTLVLHGCGSIEELPRDIGSLKNLRYLDLSYTGITVLPDSSTGVTSLQESNLSNSQPQRVDIDFGGLEQLRHLNVSSTKIKTLPASISRLSNLRTFMFDDCRYLEVLPSEFANLTHLNCLDLSGTRIKELHESIISGLCNLETLKLWHCKLPHEVGHLECLKHLIFEGDKFETPRGIRKLTCLQTLQQFVVREDNEPNGGGIGDLKDLNLLKGKIKICKLENVKDTQDAERANLKGKHHLRCLDLHWSLRPFDDKYSSDDSMVLDSLQPHPDLEILKIKNFMGSGPPQWMGDSLSSYLPKLEELVLAECSQWQQLPALGKLPNLKVLFISRMSSMKCLGNELYGGERSTTRPRKECSQWEQLLALEKLSYLEILSMNGMRSVKRLGNELHEGEGSTSGKQSTGLFPSLIELTLEYMEKLESWDAPQSTLSPFPLLEKLTISFCNKLKVLHTPFPSLKELKLQQCQSLEVLPYIKYLKSLKRFTIEGCMKLELSPDDLKHVLKIALLCIDRPVPAF